MIAVGVPPGMIGIAENGETVVMGTPEMIEIDETTTMTVTMITITMVAITMIMTTTLIITMRPATVVER
jgi:hypothetical protein